ncbi:hypothetical protein HAZT_HAZT003001 [Hyalella azteca]|uniref:SET domain-containing protein n=1 Tax=Hyalella azteca TaxID=294128 RepID=A0A6A0H4Q3_HYAAZ|nr:hypothetical protein HAZT_HAZT003001 [Hyalella azteca]
MLKESPLLVGPKEKSSAIVCLGCHRAARDYRCIRCHYPLCGPQCQTAKYHKFNGASQSALSHVTVLRVLLTQKFDHKTWQLISDMQDHFAEIKRGDLYRYFMTNVVDFLMKVVHYEEADEATILRVCGILMTNSFEVKHNGSRVRGLYHTASKMAHSCVANTKHVFEDDLTGVFIATQPITKGTPITVNYSQVLWNTMARRQHLKVRIVWGGHIMGITTKPLSS